MRTPRVVFFPPHFRLHLHFPQGVEDLQVQMLITYLRVETFDEAVLPGTTRVDVQRVRAAFRKPLLQHLRDEFRAVITADKCGVPYVSKRSAKIQIRSFDVIL